MRRFRPARSRRSRTRRPRAGTSPGPACRSARASGASSGIAAIIRAPASSRSTRRDDERHPLVERRHAVLANHRERVDGPEPARGDHSSVSSPQCEQSVARVVLVQSARRAALDAQLAAARALPELAVLGCRLRPQVLRRLGPVRRPCGSPESVTPASVPSTTVPCVDSQPPLPCATAISAPATCASPRLAAQLPRRFAQQEQAAHARMRRRESAAVGVGRERAAEPQVAAVVGTNGPPSPFGAKPEILEHDQHRVGERVVHREHVDVGRA